MGNLFGEIAFTPAVQAVQTRLRSRRAYAAQAEGPATNGRFGPDEAAFIAARDSFYLASVGETGWPYVQHRGGPAGFLKVLDEGTLGFADYRGNRQYVSVGNLAGEDRVCLFLMDYGQRLRLKILGRARVTEAPEDLERLATPDYQAVVERGILIDLAAFDWNCPQHIVRRFTAQEIAAAFVPLERRIAELEAELAVLKGQAPPPG